MDSNLPATGTAQLLTLLSTYVPDTFINDLMPRPRDRGRRQQFSPAQLYRIHLLSVLTPVHSFNQLVRLLAEQRAWRRFAHLSNRHAVPDVWMFNQFRERVGVSGLRQINERILKPLLPKDVGPRRGRRSDRCDGFGGRLFRAQKKTTGKYSALRAALGGRTLKCGQSRFFVGYKKHTFRLWLRQHQRGVLLVPLVSWVSPANYGEGGFLKPSVIYCHRRWRWHPNIIVADMGYIEADTKRQLRETRRHRGGDPAEREHAFGSAV